LIVVQQLDALPCDETSAIVYVPVGAGVTVLGCCTPPVCWLVVFCLFAAWTIKKIATAKIIIVAITMFARFGIDKKFNE
jgi:hypothetical protein